MARYVCINIAILSLTAALSACATTQVEQAPVEIATGPIETCHQMSALTRVTIPAKTQVYYATTMIDNPPYEPIERTEKMEREIEPERVVFMDSNGVETTDICDPELNPDAPTNLDPGPQF